MFKKTILTILSLTLLVGVLAKVPSAEARKYRNHYKLNYKVELDGVSADVVRALCESYSCGWQDQKAVFYRGDIIDHGKKVPVFISKRGAKTRVRLGGLSHKEENLWKTARLKGKKIVIDGRSFKLKGLKRTDGEGGYETARGTNDYIPTRYVKRACLKRRRCRKALYRYVRKHHSRKHRSRKHRKRARYIPTSYHKKRRHKRRLKRRR